MENYTIESAKQFLKDNGYFVDNLWSVHDVQKDYNCTEQEAQTVLSDVLESDRIKQEINESIDIVASGFNLPKKENDSELLEEFEEGAQNRFRNNYHRSFEEWKEDKLND